MVRVARVLPGSIAEEVDVVPGTEIRTVNGRAIDDFLDWEFLTADDNLEIEVVLPSGDEVVLEIERPEGEPLGVELEPPTVRRCANRCEFCFIEGLPKGLRRPLYIRDDDYRLSFAYGNFATLSNLKERDFERILEYRLSPLYVSVHATPWEARKKLLNNPRVPNIVEQLTRLVAGGIQFHGQMVIVPSLNDGDVLEASLTDLWSFGDACLSVAIVPVGLTQFSHLYSGESMSRDRSRELLTVIQHWSERAQQERGHAWVHGSDELYLLAEVEFPPADHYGDFPQIENGVGAVTALRGRVLSGLATLPRMDGRRIGVVTGLAMRAIMPQLLTQLHGATGAHFEMVPVENSLFGSTTTTAGLLVGADILRALSGRGDLDAALIPAETINEDGIFLDDLTFTGVCEALSMPVFASHDFIDVLQDDVSRAVSLAGSAAT